MARQRVGVFGGTSDPIHYGHLVAAEEVRYQCHLDKVAFMPAGTPPHKLGQTISPAEHRLMMVDIAVRSNPYFECSDIDIRREGPSYTVHLLEHLRGEWPDTDLYFIMGRDSLANLPTWYQPRRLGALARLVVVDRPRYEVDLAQLEAAVPGLGDALQFVPIPGIAFASSDIQRRVREGRPIKYQLPEAVEAYIYAQGLYTPPQADV